MDESFLNEMNVFAEWRMLDILELLDSICRLRMFLDCAVPSLKPDE